MMVVLAILALILAIVPANLMNATGSQALKADVRKLVSALNYARTRAISSNLPVTLVLDPRDMHLAIDGSQQVGTLSRTTKFGVVDAPAPQAGVQPLAQFYPDGGASGTDLLLSYERDEYRVNVNWLTGAVSTVRN
jgi:general secretion pathway protein H